MEKYDDCEHIEQTDDGDKDLNAMAEQGGDFGRWRERDPEPASLSMMYRYVHGNEKRPQFWFFG